MFKYQKFIEMNEICFFEYEQWEYEYNAIFLKKKIGKNLQTANDTLPTPIEPF